MTGRSEFYGSLPWFLPHFTPKISPKHEDWIDGSLGNPAACKPK